MFNRLFLEFVHELTITTTMHNSQMQRDINMKMNVVLKLCYSSSRTCKGLEIDFGSKVVPFLFSAHAHFIGMDKGIVA